MRLARSCRSNCPQVTVPEVLSADNDRVESGRLHEAGPDHARTTDVTRRPKAPGRRPPAGQPLSISPATLTTLQRQAGNVAVQQLLAGDATVSRQKVPPVYTAPPPGAAPP